MRNLRSKSKRKTNIKNPIDRSYSNGYKKGASETEYKMLDVFAHYCKHNLGAEPKYGQNWKSILEMHMTKHNL